MNVPVPVCPFQSPVREGLNGKDVGVDCKLDVYGWVLFPGRGLPDEPLSGEPVPGLFSRFLRGHVLFSCSPAGGFRVLVLFYARPLHVKSPGLGPQERLSLLGSWGLGDGLGWACGARVRD